MFRGLLLILVFAYLFTQNSYSEWEKANGGKELPDSTALSAILTNGNTIIAATTKGIYYSTNNGEDWLQKNNGLELPIEINTLGIKGNNYFIGTMDGIFSSSDNCDSWIKSDNGINSESVYGFLVIGNNILAATTGGVFVSANNGNNWTPKNQGLPEYEPVNCFAVNGSIIFAGTDAGVYSSTNNGDNWTFKNFQQKVLSMVIHKNRLYISGDGAYTGVHLSTDNGNSWNECNTGLDISHSTKYFLLTAGDSVFAGGYTTGVYVTNDNGKNWLQYNDGLSPYVQGNELMLAANDKYIFVGSKGANGFCNLWRNPRNAPKIGVKDIIDDSDELLNIFPNPVNENLNCVINLPEDEIISFSITDLLGNDILVLKNELILQMNKTISFSMSDYSSGSYYIKLITKRGIISKVFAKY